MVDELRLPDPPRHLSDLHRRGEERDFGGIKVWIQKLNPGEMDACRRKAAAARAVALTVRNSEDSEEYMASLGQLVDLLGAEIMPGPSSRHDDDDDPDGPAKRELAGMLIGEKLAEHAASVQAQRLADEDSKWGKEGYLDGLREAWFGGLDAVYAAYPEPAEGDPTEAHEARRVFAELREYSDEVGGEIETERLHLIDGLMHLSIEELRARAVDQFIENQAMLRWQDTFVLWRTYISTRRVDDHDARYFDGANRPNDEDGIPIAGGHYVSDLNEDPILKELVDAYKEIEVSDAEGKGSPPATSSSASSEQPGAAATSDSSGPATPTP